jgi:hypothetical protein
MKRRALVIAATALLIGACATTETAATPAADAQIGLADPRLVGRWSDLGDCSDAVELFADGTFRTHTGATGRWGVSGTAMTFTGPGGVFRLRLDAIEPDRIVSTNEEGERGDSTRC